MIQKLHDVGLFGRISIKVLKPFQSIKLPSIISTIISINKKIRKPNYSVLKNTKIEQSKFEKK